MRMTIDYRRKELGCWAHVSSVLSSLLSSCWTSKLLYIREKCCGRERSAPVNAQLTHGVDSNFNYLGYLY